MTTLETRLYNGDRAREILENEIFQQVFTDYKAEIIDQWTKSPARAKADREELFVYLSMLNRLEAMIKVTLDAGKLAKEDLKFKQSMVDRAKSLVGIR